MYTRNTYNKTDVHFERNYKVSWPEIPDKMAEFEPAQRYAARQSGTTLELPAVAFDSAAASL